MSTGNSKNTQSIDIPFDGGMDQRTHPRRTNAPTVLEAVNVRYPQLGGVEKRNGVQLMTGGFRDGYQLVRGQGRMVNFGDELIVTDKFRYGSRSIGGVGGQGYFVNKGKIPEATSKLKAVDSTQYQVFGPDVGATSDGLLVHAWLGGGAGSSGAVIEPSSHNNGVFATVEDIATGTVISSSFQFGLGHTQSWWAPQVVIRNGIDIFVMLGVNPLTSPSFPGIIYSKWDRSTMSWSALASLATPTATNGSFATAANATNIFLLQASSTGIRLYVYDSSMTLVSNNLIDAAPATSGAGHIGYGIAATNTLVWGTYYLPNDPTPAKIFGFTATASGALATGPFQVDSIPGFAAIYPIVTQPVILPNGNALIANQRPDGLTCPIMTPAGAFVDNANNTRSAHWQTLASKPFVDSTSPLRVYAFVYAGGAGGASSGPDGSNIAPTTARYTHVLVDLLAYDTLAVNWSVRPIAWQAPRFSMPAISGQLSDAPLSYGWPPCSVAVMPNSQYAADLIVTRNNNGRLSLSEHVVDFSGDDRMLSCQLGQTMFATPGFYYDRARLAEVSFIYHPHSLGLTKTLTGGHLADDTYTYRAIYEFVDANGFVHQSIPSDPIQVVISGGSGAAQVRITAPCLCVTARQDPLPTDTGVRIVIYRQSLAAGTGQFLRILPQGADYLNDPRLPTIDIIDTGSPNGMAEELYTDSGVFPNVNPASFTSCVTYRNRVWIAYGHTVNYSKAFVTGSTVNFTDAFELPLEETGNITAMWVMDDTLFISTADRIYYMYADGPNDFGQQSDVNTPNRVATDFGVIDQRSIVVTQVGTLFQSRAGIQLLDRSRAVAAEPIGSRVQKDLAAFPTVVSATLHPSGRTVMFVCQNAAARSIRLVYDYTADKWSRDTLRSDSTADGAQIFDEAISLGTVFSLIVDPSGPTFIFYEDPAQSRDAGQWVTMAVSLGEVHPLGLQGNVSFLKWTVNHERIAEYNVTATWFKDYEASPYMSATFTDAQILAMPADQFSFDTSIHRAQSMRMTLIDAQPTTITTGKGARWIGLAVELDPLDNKTFKLAASQKG